jgi:putative DNA primase/helicase
VKDLEQWVCWRSEGRGQNAKRTKVPYSPRSGTRARSDDPATWGTLAEAERAAQNDFDGIGFVFATSDPYCGVDLDSCVDPETGEIEPWATKVLDELDSYTEISPSGTGLHVIVRAKLPPGGNRKGGVEMYDRGRIFTITRRRLPGTSHRVEGRQEEIEALHARLFLPEEQRAPTKAPIMNGAAASEALTDAEVLRRAMSSRRGERFARLWAGDRSGYASESEADLALCSMLAFWVGDDHERIASLVARSGLNREKWNREDYRSLTISRAIEGTTSFYKSGKDSREPSRNGHQSDPKASGFAGTITDHIPALPNATEFPVEAMPASCRRLIEEATVALGCAPELVALPMLAVLSSAVGTSRIVEAKGGWREWPPSSSRLLPRRGQ